ncbi:MAG: hypothetical protein R2783_10015 [Gelidibacter sp.]
MKKIIAILVIGTALISCKNDSKKEETTGIETTETANNIREISGKFMYYADAAVFQTKSELYGVVPNEMLEDLILQSEPLKTEPSDEVAATLKVKVSKKPENEEGWDNRIEIIEIVKVSKVDPKDNDIIKLGTENQS